MMDSENKEKEVGEEAPIHGDVLEAVLYHLPLIDLVPARRVSKAWKRAVFLSLRNFNRLKPWLIVHSQSKRSSNVTTTHAYDPRSHMWIEIKRPPINYPSVLRSSHSTLLYVFSPSVFSFSLDPLHLTWHHADSPRVWRTNPMVAVVGDRVVVAGGTWEFEDDPLAVEMYDLKTRAWTTCPSMPMELTDSNSATWLSVAANNQKMFLTEKSSGVTYSFDPSTKNWEGPCDLRPDPCMFSSNIVFASDRLMLVGLIRDGENVNRVKIWEVRGESFECREIGEMPMKLVEKLSGEKSELPSIAVLSAGDFVYILNRLAPEEVIWCEIGSGGDCRWESVRNMVVNYRTRMGSFVFTCSNIGIDYLQKALWLENWKFDVKWSD